MHLEQALPTAGKEVSSKLRTQDPDGTIHTHLVLGSATLTSLASQDSALASSASTTSEDSAETDEWASATDASDESDSEEAALSHLQRLQEMSSNWKGTQVSYMVSCVEDAAVHPLLQLQAVCK